jgi:DNA polymerase/3'-5' exonuclease PolX
MNYTYAKQIGEYLCKELEEVCLPGYCQIAGSVRREKADCGDLELVVIPIPGAPRPEFGQKRPFTSHLERVLAGLEWSKRLGMRIKDGPKYKQIVIPTENYGIKTLNGFYLDLFIVRPETWGVLFTLRTGCAEFSMKCVTPRNYGGYLPNDCKVEDGRVWRYAQGDFCAPGAKGFALNTPEECDFLELLRLGWVEPRERTKEFAMEAV